MSTLEKVARYVRSKNAGPFWVTVDIFCAEDAAFDRILAAPSLDNDAIASIYGVDAASVRRFEMADLRVLKISFPRPVEQGSTRDADSHAGQYYVSLLSAAV